MPTKQIKSEPSSQSSGISRGFLNIPELSAVNVWLFASCVLAILIAFYWPFLSGDKVFFLGDTALYFEPFCRFIGEALRQGKLPLWNPYCYAGMPQIAIPSPGIFYLPNLVFAFLPFSQGLAISLIFHQLLLAVGVFLLIAFWGWGVWPAALAGIAMAFSGYVFSLQHNFTLVAACTWIPLCALSLLKIKNEGIQQNALAIVSTAVFTALLIGTGRPEVFAPAGGILLLVAVCTKDYRLILPRLLSLGLGLVLCAPEILPVLEWLKVSRRASGLDLSEVFYFSANWYDLLGIVLAQPFGDLYIYGAKLLNLASARAGYAPYVASSLLGPVVLTFGLIGFRDKNWRYRIWCLLFLVVSLVLSLGDQTNIAPNLFRLAPVLSLVRFPAKLLIFVCLPVVLAAARGMYVVLNRHGQKTCDWILKMWFALFVIGLIPIFAFADEPVKLIGQSLSMAAVAGIGISLLIIIFRLNKIREATFGACTAALLLLNLLIPAWAYNHHGAYNHFFKDEIPLIGDFPGFGLDKQRGDVKPRIAGLYLQLFQSPPWYVGKDPNVATVYRLQYLRQILKPNTNIDSRIVSLYGFESSPTGDYYDLFTKAYLQSSQGVPPGDNKFTDIPLSRFCQMMACSYVVTQAFWFLPGNEQPQAVPRLESKLFHELEEHKFMNVRAYVVRNSLLRSYVSHNWRYTKTKEEAVDAIAHADISGFDAARQTIIEAPGGQSNLPQPQDPNKPVNILASNVVFEKDLPERIVLHVENPQPGYLILADQYYPGWKALIDGEPVAILKANAVQRAINMPIGTHTVEFVYEPESLYKGIKIALVGLVICALLLIFGLFSGRIRSRAE